MATSSLQNAPPVHRTPFLNASPSPSSQGLISVGRRRRLPSRVAGFVVRSEQSPPQSPQQDRPGRRQALAIGAVATGLSLSNANPASFAAENKKGFQDVIDRKDGYTFLYPFGWQEVAIQGQDKVFKDVIEPLESVSVNMVPTNKEDIRDLGSPQQVAEALIKKVLAPSSQKTKLVEAAEWLGAAQWYPYVQINFEDKFNEKSVMTWRMDSKLSLQKYCPMIYAICCQLAGSWLRCCER